VTGLAKRVSHTREASVEITGPGFGSIARSEIQILDYLFTHGTNLSIMKRLARAISIANSADGLISARLSLPTAAVRG